MKRWYWCMVLIALGALACQKPPEADIAGADDPRNLKVRDWQPTSMLGVKQTDVPRAKFPAIDVHNHLRRSLNDPDAVQEMIRSARNAAAHVTKAPPVVNQDSCYTYLTVVGDSSGIP